MVQILLLALLSLPARANDFPPEDCHAGIFRNAVDLGAQPEPDAVKIPATLSVCGHEKFKDHTAERIRWHYRNAALLLPRFAQLRGVRVERLELPQSLEFFKSPEELSQILHLPLHYAGAHLYVYGRVNMLFAEIYLGRREAEDLYRMLALWALMGPQYHWGENLSSDVRAQDIISDFAEFAMDKKNWLEPGGNSRIWN